MRVRRRRRRGDGRVFHPHDTAVRVRVATAVVVFVFVIVHVAVVLMALGVIPVVAMTVMLVVVMPIVLAAPLQPGRGGQFVVVRGRSRDGRQMPTLERHGRSVARGFAIVDGRVNAGTAVNAATAAVATATAAGTTTATTASAAAAPTVGRPPTAAQPDAAWKEQLEEQSLELLAEYHVDDEVDGRIDGDQQVADLDQLVDSDAVERFGHVRYERPHVAQQEHDDHAQQHGGQPYLLLLQPGQSLSFPVGHPHLEHINGVKTMAACGTRPSFGLRTSVLIWHDITTTTTWPSFYRQFKSAAIYKTGHVYIYSY